MQGCLAEWVIIWQAEASGIWACEHLPITDFLHSLGPPFITQITFLHFIEVEGGGDYVNGLFKNW
jgi:hypothetical protein